MRCRIITALAVALAMLCAVGVTTGRASFILVDDFEYLSPGPIDDQGGWYAEDITSAVVADPADNGNQVLSVITESTHLYREALLLNGTIRMLFLRFRYEDQLNYSLGMSGATAPAEFNDFDVELSMTNASAELRINDGGQYATLTTLEVGQWYNCWLLIDNIDEVTAVWIHDRDGDRAYAADQIDSEGQTEFTFRRGSSDDLRSFYIKTGGGNGVGGPLYLDDIYLENTDALNLANPANPNTAVRDVPTVAALRSISPNPFNPRTTITFSLPRAEWASVVVYGVAGRRLAELAKGNFAAGEHRLDWNGRDSGGRALPSGSYLLVLTTSSGSEARKMMLMK